MEGILEGSKKVGREADRHEGRRGNAVLLTNERKEAKEGSKIFRKVVTKERRKKGGSRKEGGKNSKEEWKD